MLVIWAVAVGAGIGSTGPLFDRLADSRLPKGVESVAANEVIAQGNDSSGTVIGVVDGIDPVDARVRAAVLAAVPRLVVIDGVKSVQHPYGQTGGLVSSDGRAVILAVVRKEPEKAAEKYRRFAGLGVEVADGKNRWKDEIAAAPPAVQAPPARPVVPPRPGIPRPGPRRP